MTSRSHWSEVATYSACLVDTDRAWFGARPAGRGALLTRHAGLNDQPKLNPPRAKSPMRTTTNPATTAIIPAFPYKRPVK